MKDEYGYNGKPPKKRGRFMEYVVKYNKIAWILLIAFAMYMGRGTLSKTIHTFTDWEEIQEAKGDVILVQRLFTRDRFYQEDPATFQDVVQLQEGTYSHNVRVGSDITLEQEKFEFNNGDIYRHITLPYVETLEIMDIDTVKMFTRFMYSSGSAYYYDREKQEWAQIKGFHGGSPLPQNTLMYMNFDDKFYVLIDQLYAYEEEDAGVYKTNSELTHLSHMNRQGDYWEVIQPFSMRQGMSYQSWMLTSSTPLIDLDSSEPLAGLDHTEKELILRDMGLGGDTRWLTDGFYTKVQEGYTPYGEDLYYRTDSAEQLELLLAAEDSTAASEIAFIRAYKMAQNINEYGYFEIPVQNTQLYNDYGIRYGYADLNDNAQIGSCLVTAAKRFGTDAFEDGIRALADFFAARLAEGTLPEYWHYKGEIKTVPASAQTLKETTRFLRAAAELLGDDTYRALADSL